MKKPRRKIGFICPLSDEGSDTRKRSDDLMKNIIEPIATELGFDTERADKKSGPVIMDDVIEMLREADIVIADLTGFNPNVFYELGIRQATKGKCINIINDEHEKLPFDIGYTRAIRYKYKKDDGDMYEAANQLREQIKQRILNEQKEAFCSCMKLESREIQDIYGVTVVSDFLKGEKNHYKLAKELFSKPVKNIFLMQRSSSLVLNAEQGWGEEKKFLDNLKKQINRCSYFYHIITLEGIEAHIKRKNSVFPHFKDFASNLEKVGGNVAIRKDNNAKSKETFYLRKLQKDNQNTLFKLDRQARVLIVEYMDEHASAVIVQNLGSDQTCFLLEGPKAKEYFDVCVDFYNKCELVEWREIERLYQKYTHIELSKGK